MNKLACDCNVLHKEEVAKAIGAMPKAESITGLSEVLKVIGDETRLKILFLLLKNELCVCDISNALNMTKSAVSHQLSVLKNKNLVASERRGKEVFYKPADDHVFTLLGVGLEHIEE